MQTDDIKEIRKILAEAKLVGGIVSCPENPIIIEGITAADALDANDVMGTQTKLAVPKSGIIYSATFWDMDDEGSQVDLEVFNAQITQTANDAAWAPTDMDLLGFITELAFVAFDDHGTGETSDLTNIGKGYTAPSGFLYIQAVTRSTPNIAAGNMPRFQLQIINLDPDWYRG